MECRGLLQGERERREKGALIKKQEEEGKGVMFPLPCGVRKAKRAKERRVLKYFFSRSFRVCTAVLYPHNFSFFALQEFYLIFEAPRPSHAIHHNFDNSPLAPPQPHLGGAVCPSLGGGGGGGG